MRFKYLAGIAAAALLLSHPAAAAELTANTTIVNAQNVAVGQAQLRQGAKGVLISIQLHEMPPGPHGLHFHAVGMCDDPATGFQNAGAHTKNQSKNAQHGLLNSEGPENGDLPNIFVGADGTAQAEFYSSMISLNVQKKRDNLIDKDGSALVIHANADDHMSQPIGNSGDRIACGVITSEATADQVPPRAGPPGAPSASPAGVIDPNAPAPVGPPGAPGEPGAPAVDANGNPVPAPDPVTSPETTGAATGTPAATAPASTVPTNAAPATGTPATGASATPTTKSTGSSQQSPSAAPATPAPGKAPQFIGRTGASQ